MGERDAMQAVTGVVLAGGQSRRMGRDKALLALPTNPQETFLVHLMSVLQIQCEALLLVVRDAEQAVLYAPRVSVPMVCDAIPNIGPLMGIYSGLRAISSTHALVTAVDMPCVQPMMLAFLLSQLRTDALIVPVVANIPQVLCAIYPRSVLPLLERCLSEGRRDPRALLEVAPVRYLAEEDLRTIEPDLRSFLNVNTPGEYAMLL